MDWCYVTLGSDGYLREDDGTVYVSGVRFSSADEAEQYLEDQDLRATLR